MTAPDPTTTASRLRWELRRPAESVAALPAADVHLPDGSAFRAAPLLEIVESSSRRLVAVGQTQVRVHADGRVDVLVLVRALWRAEARTIKGRDDEAPFTAFIDWCLVPDDAGVAARLDEAHRALLPSAVADPETAATALAKALAERSRNTVAELRSLRYGLERLLAAEIRRSTKEVEGLLADVLELSTAAGRARDEAREAVREGLWTWRTDGVAYHAQRRLLDRSLPARATDRDGRARSWFGTLDAGIRQCAQIEAQLGEEAAVLHGLLSAASTIAVTRDARSQESLTLIAAVGGILLGVPGLVLALYGASSVLPLSGKNSIFVVPLVGAACLAVVIAAVLPVPGWANRVRRVGTTLLAVVVTTILLMYAGGLVSTPR